MELVTDFRVNNHIRGLVISLFFSVDFFTIIVVRLYSKQSSVRDPNLLTSRLRSSDESLKNQNVLNKIKTFGIN